MASDRPKVMVENSIKGAGMSASVGLQVGTPIGGNTRGGGMKISLTVNRLGIGYHDRSLGSYVDGKGHTLAL